MQESKMFVFGKKKKEKEKNMRNRNIFLLRKKKAILSRSEAGYLKRVN